METLRIIEGGFDYVHGSQEGYNLYSQLRAKVVYRPFALEPLDEQKLVAL